MLLFCNEATKHVPGIGAEKKKKRERLVKVLYRSVVAGPFGS